MRPFPLVAFFATVLPGRMGLAARGAAILMLCGVLACPAVGEARATTSLVELGKRLYERGILPDGTPLVASQPQGDVMRGAQAACANCHRRSGYGSSEGAIRVPPVAGAVLFAPGAYAATPSPDGQWRGPARPFIIERFRARSAYDWHSLQRALNAGRDPDGVPLASPMPRYRLDRQSISALAAYLRHLSKEAPGTAGGILHLGVVITPEIGAQPRAALLDVLRAYAAAQEQWGMRWEIHVWQLHGPPATWDAQLAGWYRHQPVFALLSGAGRAEWQPVHRFCERHAVACVLPSLELAPARDGDYYSLYFSAGLALEARLLAHRLQLPEGGTATREVIQVVADTAGRRAAAALASAAGLTSRVVRPAEFAAAGWPEADVAVVWWLRPAQVMALAATLPPPDGELFLSATLASPEQVALEQAWKSQVHYLSPFDPLAPRRAAVTLLPWLARQGLADSDLRLRGDAYAACHFFNLALAAVQGETARGIPGALTRERVLEKLESLMTLYRDDHAPYYWQMSLGPGQRLAVKGAAVLPYPPADGGQPVPTDARIVP